MAGDKKRMVQGYEVKHAAQLGGGEVIFAEDKNAEHPYMVCDCEYLFGIELFQNIVSSSDYAEMMRVFSVRITERADMIMEERAKRGIPMETINDTDVHPKGETNLKDCVVVIKPEKLAPEYRFSSYQLALCTGGFGARPNARGRAVYCQNLYTAESRQWTRDDIAGVISPDRLPDWAREKLAALQKPAEKKSVIDKIREGKTQAGAEKPDRKNHDKGGPEH